MSSFPGALFTAGGVSLDAMIPDLTEEKLIEYPHRLMVVRDGAAPIARVWLLVDDAAFAAVPPVIVAEAVKLVLAGKAIVILGCRLEPAVDVRDGPWQGFVRDPHTSDAKWSYLADYGRFRRRTAG